MKILKVILIIIVSIAAVVAIAGLILPSNAHVERTKVLKSQPEAVFKQINDLKNWHSWMPWYRMDKNMQVTFGDKTSGEGANYSWNSKVVGNGKVIISKSVPTESVETAMDFDENGKGTSTYTLYKMDSGTKVTWGFDCDMGANPFKKAIGTLMMKLMMRSDFDRGLLWIDSAASVAQPMDMPITASADSTKTASDASTSKQ
jgi:hypothetical protein